MNAWGTNSPQHRKPIKAEGFTRTRLRVSEKYYYTSGETCPNEKSKHRNHLIIIIHREKRVLTKKQIHKYRHGTIYIHTTETVVNLILFFFLTRYRARVT